MSSIQKDKIKFSPSQNKYFYDFPAEINGKKKRVYGKTPEEVIEQYKEVEKERKIINSTDIKTCLLHYISLISTASYKQKIQLKEMVEQNSEYLTGDINNRKEVIENLTVIYNRYLSSYSEKIATLTKKTIDAFVDRPYNIPKPEEKKITAIDNKFICDIRNHSLRLIEEKGKSVGIYIAAYLKLMYPFSYDDIRKMKMRDFDVERNVLLYNQMEYKLPQEIIKYIDLKREENEPLFDLKESFYTSNFRIYNKMCEDCGYSKHSFAKTRKYIKEHSKELNILNISSEDLTAVSKTITADTNNAEQLSEAVSKGDKATAFINMLKDYNNLNINIVKDIYQKNKESFTQKEKESIEGWLFIMELKSIGLNG